MGDTVDQRTRSMRNARLAAVLSVLAVLAMCAFIFYMSDRPADESDAMSLGVVHRVIEFIVPQYDQMSPDEQLYWQNALNYPIRKMAHFLEYAALGALMLNMIAQLKRASAGGALGAAAGQGSAPAGGVLGAAGQGGAPAGGVLRVTAGNALAAWALSTAYAGTDEFHQLFVAGRAGKPTDVLIDSSGVLLGVAIVALIIWAISRDVLDG